MAGALLEMQLAKQLYPDKKKKEAVVVQAVQKTVEAQYIYIYIYMGAGGVAAVIGTYLFSWQ